MPEIKIGDLVKVILPEASSYSGFEGCVYEVRSDGEHIIGPEPTEGDQTMFRLSFRASDLEVLESGKHAEQCWQKVLEDSTHIEVISRLVATASEGEPLDVARGIVDGIVKGGEEVQKSVFAQICAGSTLQMKSSLEAANLTSVFESAAILARQAREAYEKERAIYTAEIKLAAKNRLKEE